MSKKVFRNNVIITCVLVCVFVICVSHIQAEEESEYICKQLPSEYDPNVSYADIQRGIADFIFDRGMKIQRGTPKYSDLMYDFLYGDVENIDDVTERYFADYASVYIFKMQEAQVTHTYYIQMDGTINKTKEDRNQFDDN